MPNASQRVKALLSSRPPAVKIKLDLYRYRYCTVQYERRRRGAQLRFVATVPWKRQRNNSPCSHSRSNEKTRAKKHGAAARPRRRAIQGTILEPTNIGSTERVAAPVVPCLDESKMGIAVRLAPLPWLFLWHGWRHGLRGLCAQLHIFSVRSPLTVERERGGALLRR